MKRLALFLYLISFASVYGQGNKTFEIWNWEDLSLVMQKQAEGYNVFKLMQNLGSPENPGTFGLGYGSDGIQGTSDDCPYANPAKKLGSYGYENAGCGWNSVTGWTPIGTYTQVSNNSTKKPFLCIFEGNKYTINDLWINNPTVDCQGLFGYVANPAVIKDIAVTTKKGKSITGHDYVGGIVGHIVTVPDAYGKIYDTCMMAGAIRSKAVIVATGSGAGGVVGSMFKAILEGDMINESEITTNSYGGGIAGNISSDSRLTGSFTNNGKIMATGNWVGGITGSVSNNSILSGIFINNAPIVSVNPSAGVYTYIGGITGNFTYGVITNGTVFKNTGEIIGNGLAGGIIGRFLSTQSLVFSGKAAPDLIQISNRGSVSGGINEFGSNFGGVFGIMEAANATITDFANFGQISGHTYVGGIVGLLREGTIGRQDGTTVANTGAIKATGDYAGGIAGWCNSYMLGNLVNSAPVTSTANRVGGIVGFMNRDTINGTLLNTREVKGSGDVGGIIGMMLSPSTLAGNFINFADVTADDRFAGGIIGEMNAGSIQAGSFMQNRGNIKGNGFVGGIMGNMSTTTPGIVFSGKAAPDVVCVSNSGTISHNGGASGSYYGNLFGRFVSGTGVLQDYYNTLPITGYHHVGGLIGELSSGTIKNAYNKGNVTADAYTGTAGGIVASMTGGTMSGCYNTGTVSGNLSGGGIGYLFRGNISACYSLGNVTGDTAGGFIGKSVDGGSITANVTASYSAGKVFGKNYSGGFLGSYVSGIYTNCYSDKTTSQQTAATGTGSVTGISEKTTSQLAGILPSGFDAAWRSGYNGKKTYPYLLWQTTTEKSNEIGYVTINPKADVPAATNNIHIVIENDNIAKFVFNPHGTTFAPLPAGVSNIATVSTAGQPVSVGVMSESDIIAFDVSTTWEIWNWEDLSQVLSKQTTESCTNFILMQDLGIPGQPSTYGNAYENPDCPYYHTNKAYGWYGYQGFTGNESAFNPANTTNACGWTATGWTAIGTSTTGNNFTSVFDGQHHTITGIWINKANDYQGLFGVVTGATLQNLTVKTNDDKGGIVGRNCIGILAGRVNTNTVVDSCHARGRVTTASSGGNDAGLLIGAVGNLNLSTAVTATVKRSSAIGNIIGDSYVGGLIGFIGANNLGNKITIENCYSKGDVKGSFCVGGIVGRTRTVSAIRNSYSMCDVIGTNPATSNSYAGGFAGAIIKTKIDDCFSTGSVTAYGYDNGGFVGGPMIVFSVNSVGEPSSETFLYSYINNCYSLGTVIGPENSPTGGFLGINFTGSTNMIYVTNCYYNTETSGRNDDKPGITRQTSAELSADLPAGFNPAVWGIYPGKTYPYLLWQENRTDVTHTWNVEKVTHCLNGTITQGYGGPCLTTEGNIGDVSVFTVKNIDAHRIYLPHVTDIEFSGDTETATIVHTRANQSLSIGFVSASDIIAVIAPLDENIALIGTVFPFVYYEGEDEFNALFPITVSLKSVPDPSSSDPFGDLMSETPLFPSVTAVHYDGTTHVPNTPKHPGYIGLFNNPGLPINWSDALGVSPPPVNTDTLLMGQIPQDDMPIGLFKIDGLTPGTYILEIKRDGFLIRYAKIEVTSDPVQYAGHRELVIGDLNEDLLIDSTDDLIIQSNQATYGESAYIPKYDLNADGVVDSIDSFLLQTMIGVWFYHYQETLDWMTELGF